MTQSSITVDLSNNPDRGFWDWKKRVDAIIGRKRGLSADDLPDCCYADWYEEDVSPARAAARAIRMADGGDEYE